MRVVYTFPMGSEGWTEDGDLPVAPSSGDQVHGPDGSVYVVRHVVFYPWGDTESGESTEPFIYVVLRK